MTQPPKTREYTYLVGRVPLTAMLTEEQAQRMGAKLVEDDQPEPEDKPEPDTDAVEKSRRARPKKA